MYNVYPCFQQRACLLGFGVGCCLEEECSLFVFIIITIIFFRKCSIRYITSYFLVLAILESKIVHDRVIILNVMLRRKEKVKFRHYTERKIFVYCIYFSYT